MGTGSPNFLRGGMWWRSVQRAFKTRALPSHWTGLSAFARKILANDYQTAPDAVRAAVYILIMRKSVLRAAAFVALVAAFSHTTTRAQSPASLRTRNVVLIVLDGVRPEEVFTGAEAALMDSEHGGIWADPQALRREFWRDDTAARRAALMPFLWDTVAKQGQIFGSQQKGSIARVTNGMAFSYPGYNEMLTGHPDPRINSNVWTQSQRDGI